MQKINRKMTVEEAFSKSAALCARSEHAPADIEHKLSVWGLNEEQKAEVMQKLFMGNYIDTKRYAHAFVHDKLVYAGWGRRKIEYTLRLKDIEAIYIDEALSEIDNNQYISILNRLLAAKMRQTKATKTAEMRLKLLRYAAGRGFETELTDKVINDLMQH